MLDPIRRSMLALAGLLASLSALGLRGPHRGPDDERGDVPGWVLVTVMTAGLVAGLWAVAGPELERMLRQALNSVA
jgi:hypothetical protein